MDAIGAIVDALANAIVVEYFCVYGTLRPVESVCVGCKARILILRQPIEWDGKTCICLLPLQKEIFQFDQVDLFKNYLSVKNH